MTECLKSIQAKLLLYFDDLERPANLCAVEESFRKRFLAEFDILESFDWYRDTPSQLSNVYEPSTFLSPVGHRYLLPRVFQFCLAWGAKARETDFISVYFYYPIFESAKDFFSVFSAEQRKVMWEVIKYVHVELDFDILEETELIAAEMLLAEPSA